MKQVKKKKRIRLWAAIVLVVVIVAGEIVYRTGKGAGEGPQTVTFGKPDTAGMGKKNVENTNRVYPAVTTADNMSRVAIVQSDRADAQDIEDRVIDELVRQAVDLAGGLRGIVRDGDTVVLKPNLVVMKENNKPDSPPLPVEVNGVTTDWRVTRAVVKLVRRLNPSGKVYVMECTAMDRTRKVMDHFGYVPQYIRGVDEFIALEEAGGKWQDTASGNLVKVVLTNGFLHKEYYLNKIYFEADVLISLPTLKNHSSAVMTGSLKNVGIGATPPNIYGMASDNILKFTMVNHFSDDLHKWIRDYNLCRKINFVVMDGLQGLQNGPTHNDGPLSNDQMNMRLILAGKDPVAVDTVEALVANWDPTSINYLKYLDKDRFGNTDVRKITVVGKRVDEVRKTFDGMNPMAGGRKVFDFVPPEINQMTASMRDGDLRISLNVDKKAVKAEVLVDGKLLEPVAVDNFTNIVYRKPQLAGGNHLLLIRVYDQYLNQSEAQATLQAE